MKMKTEYLVLILIIGALSAYLIMQKSGKTHYTLPSLSEIEKKEISKLTIKSKETEIDLIKENDQWFVGPQKFPADPQKTEGLVDALREFTLTSLVSESKNYTLYELDEENRILVEALNNDIPIRTIHIGKPASSHRHTFVMVDDDHRVFHSEGNLKNKFTTTLADLRDKGALTIDEDIMEMIITKGDGAPLTFTKSTAPVTVDVTKEQEAAEEESTETPGEPEIIWVTSGGKSANKEMIEEIIRTVSHLQCDEYIENKTKEDLTSPTYTLTMKGAQTYTLSLYEKTEDNKYPAISSVNDYPFLITEWKANRIMKDPAEVAGEASGEENSAENI